MVNYHHTEQINTLKNEVQMAQSKLHAFQNQLRNSQTNEESLKKKLEK